MIRKMLICSSALAVTLGCVCLVLWSERDTSTYSSLFSEQAFRQICQGMSAAKVHQLLGAPLAVEDVIPGDTWLYGPGSRLAAEGSSAPLSSDHVIIFDSSGAVRHYRGGSSFVVPGLTKAQVSEVLGAPTQTYEYRDVKREYFSKPGTHGRYNARVVGLDESGLVTKTYEYTTSE